MNTNRSNPTKNTPNGRKHIILYELLQNIPTGDSGDRGMVQHLVNNHRKDFDEIWILPVDGVPEENAPLLEYNERFELCELNFSDIDNSVKVVNYENIISRKLGNLKSSKIFNSQIAPNSLPLGSFKSINSINFTSYIGLVDVILQLKRDKPSYDFSLILGKERYNDLLKGKLKLSKKIFEEVEKLYVFRNGTNSRTNNNLSQFGNKVVNVVSNIPTIKSSDLSISRLCKVLIKTGNSMTKLKKIIENKEKLKTNFIINKNEIIYKNKYNNNNKNNNNRVIKNNNKSLKDLENEYNDLQNTAKNAFIELDKILYSRVIDNILKNKNISNIVLSLNSLPNNI